jgi:hypothetical protein
MIKACVICGAEFDKHGHAKTCSVGCKKAHKAVVYNAYREANREKISARLKAYREANREKIRAGYKAHYEANRETILARKMAHYEANRETILARKMAHYEANRETILAQCKAYREDNIQKLRASKALSRRQRRRQDALSVLQVELADLAKILRASSPEADE